MASELILNFSNINLYEISFQTRLGIDILGYESWAGDSAIPFLVREGKIARRTKEESEELIE